MGWAHCGTDDDGREIGYGVEAECDFPGCPEKIDRGLGYVCGPMHGSGNEWGCGRYYCGKHLDQGVHKCEGDPHPSSCPEGQHRWKTHVSPSTPDDPGGERTTWCEKCGEDWSEEIHAAPRTHDPIAATPSPEPRP